MNLVVRDIDADIKIEQGSVYRDELKDKRLDFISPIHR